MGRKGRCKGRLGVTFIYDFFIYLVRELYFYQEKIRENLKSHVCGDMLFDLNGMSFRISVYKYM